MQNKFSSSPFIRVTFLMLIFSTLLMYSCTKKEQAKKQFPQRSAKELMTLVSERHRHETKPGEYEKGDWQTVKQSTPPEGISWNYPWGVTLYGILEVSKTLEKPDYSNFVAKHNKIAADQYAYLRWQEKEFGKYTNPAGMKELMMLSELDHCGAMGAQFLESILEHDAKVTPEMEMVIDTIAGYISTEQARLDDGTLWRPTRKQTIWADDLYMSTPFLIRYAEYSEDQSYLNDAVKQILNMASYLQDEDGVWFHGYSKKNNDVTGFKWSRANGWAMVSEIEVLSAMPANHPQKDAILDVLKDHIDGIKPLQTKNGMWRQILDNPNLWEETSATAMFTYSICKAVNDGFLDKEYLQIADKAVKGLNQNINEEGAILGVCQGTGIGYDLQFYINRKQPFDDDHGHGAVLLALSEYYKAKNN